MNKTILFLSLLTILCLGSFAQDIPNSSFETWAGGEPNDWNTSNQNIVGFDFITVQKETANPQQGSASARLTVVTKTIPFVGT